MNRVNIKNIIKRFFGRFFKIIFPLYPGLENIHIILMYHRVLEKNPNGLHDPSLFISSRTFEMHIREVVQLFDIVPLGNIFKSKKETGRLCTITFDDGWSDNYSYAFPILKKYRVPATIFIPVEMVGTNQCFWFDDILTIANVSKENGNEKKFIQYFQKLIPMWNPKTLDINHLSSLTSALKNFPGNILDDLVEEACINLDIKASAQKTIINWDQAFEMGKYMITFGSHGLRHWILNNIENHLKRREIFVSLEVLRSKDVEAVPFFSYPNGNWNEKTIDFLSEAGYEGGLTAQIGYNTSHTHPFLLNRVGLHEHISNCPDLFWFRIFQAILGGSGFQQNSE